MLNVYYENSLIEHEKHKGKISITSKVPLENLDHLSTYYSPGVAIPCKRIASNKAETYRYTCKGNMVAIVSDGSAVLGLGNVGASAAIPVMEGKAILFKTYGNIDAFPICIDTQDTAKIIDTVVNISPMFGGINLEDISSPRCAEIERTLDTLLDIPVFHDDQHGTAIVVMAALINALKATKRSELERNDIKIVICGAGSAGLAIAAMLSDNGYKNVTLVGRAGVLTNETKLNWYQKEVLETLMPPIPGHLEDALKNADVFIGVSTGGILSKDMVSSMKKDSIVFALANPEPEILPELAHEAGAAIVGTGRSDFKNQINNLLAFPGVFRGALDARTKITAKMKNAAAYAIAGMVSEASLVHGYVVPSSIDPKVHQKVAEAVYMASLEH